MKRQAIHPDWCGRNHVCSADGPRGEHRSYPMTVDTEVGRLVATRIQTKTGRARLELRIVVDVPQEPAAAQDAVRRLVFRICQAIKAPKVTR